jgi:hypothetical protein
MSEYVDGARLEVTQNFSSISETPHTTGAVKKQGTTIWEYITPILLKTLFSKI